MATDNPLSAFFRGFQGAQTRTQQLQQQQAVNQLNEQLRQVQLLTAQKQLEELSKTPQQRLIEQLTSQLGQKAIQQPGIVAAPLGPIGEPQAITQDQQNLLNTRLASELAGGPEATAEGIVGTNTARMQTAIPGLPGFAISPAAQAEELKAKQEQLRSQARLSRDIEKEFQTPAEIAATEASLSESKLKTAKSTAILSQIEKSAATGGKKTQPVYDPTGTQVIAYEYFDPIKGTTDLIDIKTPKDAESFKSALDQSNKFDDDASVKNYVSAISSMKGIQNLASDPNATAADDTALIFAFMKSIDPRSTVREGEQASVQNSAGIPDRIRNIYNNAVAGNRLTPNQRLEIFGAAEKSVSGLKTGYNLARTRFIDKARRSNLDENIVVGPELDHKKELRINLPNAQTTTTAKPQTVTSGQIVLNAQGQRFRVSETGEFVPVQ